jgi:hypothetical protein
MGELFPEETETVFAAGSHEVMEERGAKHGGKASWLQIRENHGSKGSKLVGLKVQAFLICLAWFPRKQVQALHL